MTLPSCSLSLSFSFYLSYQFSFLLLSATSVLSPSLGDLLCSPRLAHSEQLIKQQRLPRRQLCNASYCFVLQAEHLICGEVLALTNNTSASCNVLHRITLFDIIPLEISICSLMNTDCVAIGVISISDASALMKSEKVTGSIELRKTETHSHCLSVLLWRRNILLNGSVA